MCHTLIIIVSSDRLSIIAQFSPYPLFCPKFLESSAGFSLCVLIEHFVVVGMAMEAQTGTHVAILPSPGMGHLIPLVAFSKRLVATHSFSITFINLITDSSAAQSSVLSTLNDVGLSSLQSVDLPPADLSDLPISAKIETRISLTVRRSLSSLRTLLCDLTSKFPNTVMVADIFGTDAFDVADELSLPKYLFFPANATALCLMSQLPALDAQVSGEFRDLPELRLPGCSSPFPGKDLLAPLQDRKDAAYSWLLHQAKRYRQADGIFVNTFEGLESQALQFLKENRASFPEVFPVGPLTLELPENDSECLRWLDEQPPGSVLFVSFGSGGTLSCEQYQNLAHGLEKSGQRFLWVIRTPEVTEGPAAFFTVESKGDPKAYLPQGFLERTKGVGMVVPSWAPQTRVLAHAATGGFLTHCGWNSTLESFQNGIPLIAWPLYAEQKMNAILLVDEIKVAIRPKMQEDGIIKVEEIDRVVRGLMEGEEGKALRAKMRDLRDAASTAVAEGGSSYHSVVNATQIWRSTV
ncbi:hypothetical protein AMTRI_Chr01g108240 [Amborella trichopoda]